MKALITSIAALFLSVQLFAQNDIVVGTSYNVNIQRQNNHADAFILHNAIYSKNDDTFKWVTGHTNGFGMRGIRFSYYTNRGIYFYADDRTPIAGAEFTPITRMFIGNHGRVGIGTVVPDAKLTVNGDIHAKEVRVDLNVPGPDYVFEDNYNLRPLGSGFVC